MSSLEVNSLEGVQIAWGGCPILYFLTTQEVKSYEVGVNLLVDTMDPLKGGAHEQALIVLSVCRT